MSVVVIALLALFIVGAPVLAQDTTTDKQRLK